MASARPKPQLRLDPLTVDLERRGFRGCAPPVGLLPKIDGVGFANLVTIGRRLLMAETRTGSMLDWNTEETYWRTNYSKRPYVGAKPDFDYWRPGYRYGYESAQKYHGRTWQDVESDLKTGWDRFEHRSKATWEQIKDAVRDGWDRVTGK
jgi:hypothetical protein